MNKSEKKYRANRILSLIGNTPLIPLRNIPGPEGAEILAKCEMFNPGGSLKDRPALNMILKAEERGGLSSGSTVVEATSGNTGIGLAMVSAIKGYKCTLVMPESSSEERRQIMSAFGAEVILTPDSEGMEGSIVKVKELLTEIPSSWHADQFENPDNPEAHRLYTGPEIISQIDGEIDAFVAGIGTGGTITGVARALKKACSNARIVGVEPIESAVLSGFSPGKHGIQGIGPGFVPKILDIGLLDEVLLVDTNEAIEYTRRLAKQEGILAGISSGAAVAVSIRIARRLSKGRRVVTILPDTGERYLSTGIFNENPKP